MDMMPDFRFVIGAVLATAVLGVTSFGLLAAVRLTHHAKVGPLQSSRSLVFDDRADWNQFYDPESARRFEELARKADAPDAAVQRAADRPADVTAPSEIAMAPSVATPPLNVTAPAAVDTAPAATPSAAAAVEVPAVSSANV